MITCTANTIAAEAGLDALLLGVEQAARPAAQAGAEVLYREVMRRVVTRRLDGRLVLLGIRLALGRQPLDVGHRVVVVPVLQSPPSLLLRHRRTFLVIL